MDIRRLFAELETASDIPAAVRAAAISPQNARELVRESRDRHRLSARPADRPKLAGLFISRYAGLSAAGVALTGLPAVVPGGVGSTAVAAGGGLAGVAASLKCQVDLCLCLVEIYQEDLPDDEKTALGLLLALPGSIEEQDADDEPADETGEPGADRAARQVASAYLRRGTRLIGRTVASRVAVHFAQRTSTKMVLLGSGVAIDAAAGYALTQTVGKRSVEILERRASGNVPQH